MASDIVSNIWPVGVLYTPTSEARCYIKLKLARKLIETDPEKLIARIEEAP